MIIVDEAHRLKNTTAATRDALAHCTRDFLLLLTGVPGGILKLGDFFRPLEPGVRFHSMGSYPSPISETTHIVK